MIMDNQTSNVKTIKDTFGKVGCYSANIAELASEINDELVVDEGGKIKISFFGWIKLIQVFWNKIKETAVECEGKEVEVNLPDGIIGNVVNTLLGAIGLKL